MKWILLRGLAREARHWGPLPEKLKQGLVAKTGEAIELHTPDHPGCGTESRRTAPLTIGEMVEDLRARAAYDYDHRPANLFGLSLGGMVALEWAARYPGEIERLVIVNSSAGDLSPPYRRLLPAALRILLGAAASRDLRRRERAGFRMTLNDPDVVTPELVERWTRIQETAPVSRSTFLRQLAASVRFRAPKAIRPPILFLGSEKDRMVDPRCTRALAARYPGSQLEIHPTAGHDLPLEDPDWVVQKLSRFVTA